MKNQKKSKPEKSTHLIGGHFSAAGGLENALKQEMIRSSLLGIDYLVLHPGAHMGSGVTAGIEQAAKSIDYIFKTPDTQDWPRLLIETTAGQGTCLGHCFEQIAALLERTGHPEITGVCMDTCHMFAAGYDIRNPSSYNKVMSDFDSIIGFDRLFAIHLNDSQSRLGSKKDRHAHIGEGRIGKTGFKLIMNDNRLKNIPKIIETPKLLNGQEMDPVNLQQLIGFID
jgi:deoxyribonuclease-4